EAETIVKADLPPDQAAAKVTALRQLLVKKQQQRADKSPAARGCQDALRCGADPRPDLPFSFFSSGPSSERFGFFTSPRPARRFAMFWNSSVVRWLLETSAIIWPLLAAVENSFESNGITAIGWLSM